MSNSLIGIRTFAACALLAAACSPSDYVGPGGYNANIPVVGANPGQFGFAVTARGWTSDQTYTPDLSTGSLQVGLSIVGYGGGTGVIAVTDADDAAVFSRSLAGNVAEGSTVVHGRPPFRVRISATGYTGVVALGVNAVVGGT